MLHKPGLKIIIMRACFLNFSDVQLIIVSLCASVKFWTYPEMYVINSPFPKVQFPLSKSLVSQGELVEESCEIEIPLMNISRFSSTSGAWKKQVISLLFPISCSSYPGPNMLKNTSECDEKLIWV